MRLVEEEVVEHLEEVEIEEAVEVVSEEVLVAVASVEEAEVAVEVDSVEDSTMDLLKELLNLERSLTHVVIN